MSDLPKLMEKMRLWREEAGLTQEQVAERLGVERKTISRWENGKTPPREKIVAWGRVLLLDDAQTDQLLKWAGYATITSLEKKAAELEALIETQKLQLQKLPFAIAEEQIGQILKPLFDQLHAVNEQIVHERDVQIGGSVDGPVITGDHNTVHLTRLYFDGRGNPILDEEQFTKVLQRYLDWVIKQYGELTLRGVVRREEKPLHLELDTLYISLKARLQPKQPSRQRIDEKEMDEERIVEMAELLPTSRRLVLIGGAGSGKTTFLHLIASQLAKALRGEDTAEIAQKLGLIEPLPLPIFITLSDYNRYRRQCDQETEASKGTLLHFISYQLIRQQQATLGLPSDFFERLLRTGKSCLLLLDGLDEVANERERQLVRQAVEGLGRNEEGIKGMIVTSRSAAYKGQVTFPAYRVAEVQAMSQTQVQWLAKRWCEAVYPSVDDARREYEALWSAIHRLERLEKEDAPMSLINTPLMTTIVAIVHYNQRRLPDQRGELYSECVRIFLAEALRPPTEATFELADWGGTPDQKQDCLAEVAWQMMQLGEKAGRTTGAEEIAQWVTQLFEAWYAPKEVEGQRRRFMGTLNERGALLQELGGEYRFVHLTFQEFLAGWYVATKVEDDQRVGLLRPYVTDSWWRETILLCAGYLGIESRPKAEKLMRGLAGVSPEEGDVALAGAEIAGQAVYELPKATHQLREEMKTRLVALLTTPTYRFKAVWRGRAGKTLAQLGDPRGGVLTVAEMPFCYVPGGDFWMGSETGRDDEKPLHLNKTLAKGYWLAQFPVTVAQFRQFLEATGQRPKDEDALRDPLNCPVRWVSWFEAEAFARWSTELGKQVGWLPEGWQISLPSEAEWEKGARGGVGIPQKPIIASLNAVVGTQIDWPSQTLQANEEGKRKQYPWLGAETKAAEYANIGESGIRTTTVVGCFPQGASVYGCEEMSGNVWEWTSSLYQSYDAKKGYEPKGREIDSGSVATSNVALRGGSWRNNAGYARVSSRSLHLSLNLSRNGFRLVVRPPSLGHWPLVLRA